ncbi:MAG: hypothetical protein M1828_006597 [Chrysothrix sp. TS-e1954]|nr:MAG: hypothetical protein M1828_006597 [Chrysothrix sp. TS-e1954]
MAAPQRARLVRRTPLKERVKAYLDPIDFLLWLSEEVSSNEWDDFQEQWSVPIGVALNVLFMLARANATGQSHTRGDEVFADYGEGRGTGWLSWFSSFLVHMLTLMSVVNAFYTFWRKRQYRLFEVSVDETPNTPSAHRVRVDSSPLASSPLRYLSSVLSTPSAQSRAHPDSAKDVWELSVWDPTPICLRLFSLFSPGHILIYWLFLPLAPLDPRPSVTVVTTILLAALLSVQLILFQTYFTQQAKDSALIQGQVQNEYDTKFVRPSLHRPVRDVGTQSPSRSTPKNAEVHTYTLRSYVNKGFQTNPNPNYVSHYDPDAEHDSYRRKEPLAAPNFHSPLMRKNPDLSSPLRPNTNRVSQYPQASTDGDGGSFGVFSHARSPLKKAQLSSSASGQRQSNGSGYLPQRGFGNHASSPLKRSATPGANEISKEAVSQQKSSQPRASQRRNL